MKISDLTDCIVSLFEVELKAVQSAVGESKKEAREHDLLIAQGYIMGLNRAHNIIEVVLRDVKNEEIGVTL